MALILIFFISLPGFCQEENDLLEIEADKKKQTKTAIELDETRKKLEATANGIPDEVQKLIKGNLDTAALLDPKTIEAMKTLMAQSPLKKLSRDEVRRVIMNGAKEKPLEKILKDNPKILDAFADILRDEKAMPALLDLFLRRKELKIYFLVWLTVLLLSWGVKKYFFSDEWSAGRRFLMAVLVTLSATSLTLSIFYKMFYVNLSPTVAIITRIYHE